MALDLFVVLIYAAGMLVLGYYGMRRAKTHEDYLVAGRNLGPTLYMGTMAATVLGGASTVGTVRLGYVHGISGFWLCAALGMGIIALNLFLAKPLLKLKIFTVLMDSILILQYAETLAAPALARRLTPADPAALLRTLRLLGLALAACEKSVQIVYEHKVRPADKLHQPWLERVTSQMLSAFDVLEAEQGAVDLGLDLAPNLDHATVMTAITWYFVQQTSPGVVDPARYPRLAELSRRAEALAPFVAAPYGDSTYKS